MHLALYRKYRPRTFDDVVGQEHVTTTLKREIAMGTPAHAYLFTGSRGTGKTSCAKILAKALNCPNQVEGNPCCTCELCTGIDDGSMLDVLEIDAASNNGVDNIRDLRDIANFTPATGKYRVYIIDEVHMLSTGAFNALLKIMEEPPAHVIFILATTEVHKVPATILSRCQRFDFHRLPSDKIAGQLQFIAGEEQFTLSADAALLIAKLSDGGMRDAISLMDLCASYNENIDVETVSSAAGVVGQQHLFELSDQIAQRNSGGAVQLIDELGQRSLDPERLCEQLIQHYRDLLLCRALGDPGELVDCLPSDLPELQRQAKGYEMEQLLYILTVLQDALGRMARTTLRRTELEMAVLRLCDPRLSASNEGLAARVEQLEIAVRTGAVRSQSQQPAGQAMTQFSPNAQDVTFEVPQAPIVPAGGPGVQLPMLSEEVSAPPLLNQAPAAGLDGFNIPLEPDSINSAAPDLDAARREAVPFSVWPEVLERLQHTNGCLYGALLNSDAYQSGKHILVAYKDELFVTLMRTNEYAKESLKQAILEVTGKPFAVGPYDQEKYAVKQTIVDPLEQFVQNLSLSEDLVIIK